MDKRIARDIRHAIAEQMACHLLEWTGLHDSITGDALARVSLPTGAEPAPTSAEETREEQIMEKRLGWDVRAAIRAAEKGINVRLPAEVLEERLGEAEEQLTDLRATLERQSGEIVGVRRELEQQRQAYIAAQAAANRGMKLALACQDYRHQLPRAVWAALKAWEKGNG